MGQRTDRYESANAAYQAALNKYSGINGWELANKQAKEYANNAADIANSKAYSAARTAGYGKAAAYSLARDNSNEALANNYNTGLSHARDNNNAAINNQSVAVQNAAGLDKTQYQQNRDTWGMGLQTAGQLFSAFSDERTKDVLVSNDTNINKYGDINMNEQLIEVLKSFKDALDFLQEENKALNDKVDELSAVLYDDILSPVQEAIKYAQDEEAFTQFNENYGPEISPLATDYAAIYDGKDVVKDIYDTYKEHSDEYDEAQFVSEACKSIAKAIEETKAKLGIPANEKVEVTETEDGVEIKAAEDSPEDVSPEDVSPKDVSPEDVSPEDVDSPEEIAAFEAELEKQIKK